MFLRHSVDPLGGGLRFPSALVYRCFYAVIISHILYKILLLDMLCLVVSLSTRRVKPVIFSASVSSDFMALYKCCYYYYYFIINRCVFRGGALNRLYV